MNTSHSGNIGAAARAMKTMGLSDLCLVSPKSFPDKQAIAMAVHAGDVLDRAEVVDSLQAAIADCHVVVGTSARYERSLAQDVLDARRCGELLAEKVAESCKVALVFGRERTGLTNEELAHCHHLVHIPTNPDYSSLNVASAVQLLAYECRMGIGENVNTVSGNQIPNDIVTSNEVQGYFQQLQNMMIKSGFLDPAEPKRLMQRLRGLYGRTQLSRSELNILHGMLSSFEKMISNDKKS